MSDTCILCGREDQSLKSDHLRECYKISQDKLDNSQFKPRMYYWEMNRLQHGANIICSNRNKCRTHQNKP